MGGGETSWERRIELREAKVAELDVPGCPHKHVVGLDVTVDNMAAVEIGQGQGHLCKIEGSHLFIEVAKAMEERGEISTNHVLHHLQ